jgi:hypothetical protein
MTEAEWLKGPAIWEMLEVVRGAGQGRKLRLFACACCRRVWSHLTDKRSRTAVNALESESDDPHSSFVLDSEASLRAAMAASHAAAAAVASENDPDLASRHATRAVLRVAEGVTIIPAVTSLSKAISAAGRVVEKAEGRCCGPAVSAVDGGELMAQSDLLLDIFGNPFHLSTLSTAHRTPTVVSLARAAYDERHLPSGELERDRLAVLADALEKAGSPAELTDHLRAPGPHVRGCHVVDLILGLT